MNLDELHSLMLELAAGISGTTVEVGRTDRARHPDVFIKLASPSAPETFAIISTSGSGTYELAVNGDFFTGRADDQAVERDEVRDYLESYVRAALAYLDGHWSMRRSAVLRAPILTIETEDARLNLSPRGRWSFNDFRRAF